MAEDSSALPIAVLDNDTDVDGGPNGRRNRRPSMPALAPRAAAASKSERQRTAASARQLGL
jgi:hypothetical protein